MCCFVKIGAHEFRLGTGTHNHRQEVRQPFTVTSVVTSDTIFTSSLLFIENNNNEPYTRTFFERFPCAG